MKKVKLFTKNGGFVTNVLIPPFNEPPKGILWGQRLFFIKDVDNYYEDFWVAAVISGPDNRTDVTEIDTKSSKSYTKHPGNDEYLFGLPSNLDEAIETFLEYYRNASDMNTIVDMTESEFISNAHHGAGQFLRNSWFLWWHENHGYKEWPASKPPLIEFFNDLGIVHADDISSIIITSAYRHIHKKAIDLDKQIKYYQNFWKKNGYPDGIPKMK